ncbi:hypothetical protein FQN50_005316 [Emmonsiellopsis sp. PD_5]|nr:hypothetical protein FQN50_005316 [Emmonsiellopsis sp. PD_5]
MSRAFSTSAQFLLRITWKGTERVPKYEQMIENSVENNSKLKDRVETVEVAGREHPSPRDPKLRVSGQLLDKDGIRITSGHWYHDGEVKFSKEEFNSANGEK